MINLIKMALMITVRITSASHLACLLNCCASSFFDCSDCCEFTPVSQYCSTGISSSANPFSSSCRDFCDSFEDGPVSNEDNFEQTTR